MTWSINEESLCAAFFVESNLSTAIFRFPNLTSRLSSESTIDTDLRPNSYPPPILTNRTSHDQLRKDKQVSCILLWRSSTENGSESSGDKPSPSSAQGSKGTSLSNDIAQLAYHSTTSCLTMIESQSRTSKAVDLPSEKGSSHNLPL